jgi:DNA invertase Pin-like site-specific DNA recombinase
MKAKRAALYVRVSSEEQNTAAQERALTEYIQRRDWKLQQIYRDHGVSGAKSNRPALNELLKACRRGSVDVVVVWKFDRFARSLKQLMSGLEMCRALGIDFVSVTESVDTSLPAGELVFQMIGAVAVRTLTDRRTREVGIGERESHGKVTGSATTACADRTRDQRPEKAAERQGEPVSRTGKDIRDKRVVCPQIVQH